MTTTALALALCALSLPPRPAQDGTDEQDRRIVTLETEIGVLQRRLSETAPTLTEPRSAEVRDNPLHVGLTERLAELEVEFVALVDGSDPPTVVAKRREVMEAEIEGLRSKLRSTPPRIELGPARTASRPNPEFTATRARLHALQDQLAVALMKRDVHADQLVSTQAAQDQVGALAARVAALERRVAALEGGRPEVDVEQARTRYAAARERWREARQDLERAESKLQGYRRKTGVIDAQEALRTAFERRETATKLTRQHERLLEDLTKDLHALHGELEETPAEVEAEDGSRVPNHARLALEERIRTYEARREQASANGESWRESLEEAKAALERLFGVEEEMRRLARAVADAAERDARAFDALLDAEDRLTR